MRGGVTARRGSGPVRRAAARFLAAAACGAGPDRCARQRYGAARRRGSGPRRAAASCGAAATCGAARRAVRRRAGAGGVFRTPPALALVTARRGSAEAQPPASS
ncbi:hypothetical protein GCM10010417_27550 [Streptomyces carpaticus]